MPTLTMSTAMMMVMVVVMMLPLAPVMTESGVVFTSMMKLQQLARMEGELLQWLDDYEKHGEIPDHLKQFAESRREVRRQHDHVELHPNSGYLLIYAFVDYWTRLTEAVPSLKELGDNAQVDLPDEDDLIGALKAILRLQSTYNLSTSAVYSGNYSGYLGPALSHRDALELGTEAFGDNDFGRTTSWLQLARDEMERERQETGESERPKEESGQPKESARPREQSEQPKEESRRPKDKPGQPKEESERPKKESGRPEDKPGRPKEESGRPEVEQGRSKEETERPKFETEGSEKDVERSKEGTEERSKKDMAMSAESSTPSSEDRDPEDQAEEEGDLKEDVLCLLGRTYLKLGDREMAEELLKEASELPIASTGNKTSRDREALEKELNPPPPAETKEGEEEEEEGKRKNKEVKVPVPNALEPESVSQTMRDLCHRHRSTILGNLKPFHMCRYKPAFQVPFLLYKEEILSLSPYVSLFRDFVSDTEIEALKGIDTTKMEPCYPQTCPRGVDNTKTGQYHRLNDSRSEMAARLSRRLGHMIWLDANDRNLSAAEGWQVMNYGLAGHDSGHVDYVRHSKTFNRNLPRSYQNRLASFLLHLSDIDMGGQIVFEKLNISVAPVKMGLSLDSVVDAWTNLDRTSGLDHSFVPIAPRDWASSGTTRSPMGSLSDRQNTPPARSSRETSGWLTNGY